MRIQISNKQLQLIQEALKDEIPQYMQDIIQKRYGEKYLDMDVPEHTPLIPDVTEEILDEKIKNYVIYKIGTHFREQIDDEWEKTKFSQLLNASYNADDDRFSTRRYKPLAKTIGGKLFYNLILGSLSDFQYPFLKENFYSKGFKLLQSKNNNIENPIYSKNKSNLFSFLISMKRAFPEYFSNIEPGAIVNEKIFAGLRNPILNRNEIYENLKKSKIYLHISANPYDILRMSVSEFYDSCQNIYTGGDTGTEWNKKLLSNVFDKNSKVAFLIFDAPFTDKMGNKHKNSPVARMIIRTNSKGGIMFDSVYPAEMHENMQKIVTDLTGLQNTGKPGDLYHYTNIEGLPEPYMDTYRTHTATKANIENPRANILADHLGVNVNVIYQYSDSYFSAPGQGNYEFYDVWTNSEADERLRDNISYHNELSKYTLKQVFLDFKVIPINLFKLLLNDEFIDMLHVTVKFEGIYAEELKFVINKLKEHQKYTKNNREDKELTDEIERLTTGFQKNWEKTSNDDNIFLEYLNKQYGISTIKELEDYWWKHKRHKMSDRLQFYDNVNFDNFIKMVYGNKIRAMNVLLTDTGSWEEIKVGNDIWYIHKADDEEA